jgi:hypothetical protein
VTKVDESIVFEESFGGNPANGGKCAYSLIYVNKKVANDLQKMPL